MGIDFSGTALGWPAVILILVLGYFLTDAHKSIKASIKEKADQRATDAAFAMHREDMEAMEKRHQDEIMRMERQHVEWRAGAMLQLSERMTSMEVNLLNQIQLVLKVVERRHAS